MASALDTRAGLAVVAPHYASEPKDKAILVADLRSGDTRSFPLRERETQNPWADGVDTLAIAADGSLLSGSVEGVERWNLATGKKTRVSARPEWAAREVQPGRGRRFGRTVIAGCWDGQITTLLVGDSSSADLGRITTHGDDISAVAMDPAGSASPPATRTGGAGRLGTGEEPHLLLGHSDLVLAVAFSPTGSGRLGERDEIFLWPIPDLTKPPLHTLPHDGLRQARLTDQPARRPRRQLLHRLDDHVGPSRAGATSPPVIRPERAP